ncbi:MAG: hypothetical protein HYR72_05125 [Deltaproteobacteria bacterium]|nr:hypothetical protein [Deltaproteobacteria bacterium]MBI3389730.1 hypothetical protein [Deltaproteobacteria bacterium]
MAHEIQRPRNGSGHGNGHGNGNANGNVLGNGNGNGNGHGNGNGNGSTRTLTGSEQVREIFHVLFKRKRLILGLFIVVALPGLAVSVFSKPKYVASAKVLITTQRGDAVVQSTDMTKLATVELNESAVNSEVHIIRSRQMLDQVVRGLAYGDGNGTARVENASLKDKDNGIDLGARAVALDTALVVTPIKASNVIQIDYKASAPEAAAQVVNRVVDEYLAYHAEVHGNKGLARFYEDQRRDLEKRLRSGEDALKEYAESVGVVAPRDEIQATVKSSADLDGTLRDVNANINGTEEKLRVVQQQLADQPPIIKRYQYLEVNPVVTQLTQQLVDRQVDRVNLLQKYTDKDRHVRDNAQEISELQTQLDDELRDRPTVVARQMLRTNPVREDRLRVLLDMEGSLKEMRARRATLEEDSVRIGRRLIFLRQKALEYDRLDQEVKNRRDAFELYVKREQEARISEAMDQERLINVDVVQRPALPLQRADNQRVSVLLSLISGIAVSLGGAFGLEYLNRSLRSEYDVEQHLGLPLLGSIADYTQA